MTYSKLATASRKESPQSSSRQGVKVDMVIVHHCANTNAQGVVDMMTIPTKQVSSNYVMTKNGPIGVVREELRAFTSGSSSDGGKGAAYDRRAITVETVNSTMGPDWGFNPQTIEHLARLIADVATRYGFPIDRDHVVGHGELYSRYRASYPTACPGPSMNLDALVRKARAYQQDKTAEPTEEEFTIMDAATKAYLDKEFQSVRERIETTRDIAEDARTRAINIEGKQDISLDKLGVEAKDRPKPAVPNKY